MTSANPDRPEERSGERTGEVIGQRYRLGNLIGRGGQGAVYRARDLKAGDEVAIKILREFNPRDVNLRERMLREAHALTVLRGTAAVQVLHQAWANDGSYCLVMELLEGQNFEDHLRQREARGEKLNLAELSRYLEPVVATLERAHHAGILHRDLKPSNLFILHTGQVRLMDFGFAKFTRMASLTQAGLVAGSPNYIAPEIWQGRTDFDQRIDVYSLAAVSFRALAGRTPFTSERLDELLNQVTRAPRPKLSPERPDLPRAVDDWFEHGLAIDPSHRFERVRAMWNALDILAH
ncbi:MAG TPA: serine/threonine-protein kinase [Polyangiaceae bacterium]|nr:serine/threonine-protein kinase [Polyangiaceae bacterium]